MRPRWAQEREAQVSNRKLVKFDLTRDDLPPSPGFNPYGETPYAASMMNEDLRVERNGDGERFMRKVILACQMIERANPRRVALMTDHELNDAGDVEALTITVIEPRGSLRGSAA
jgi:hypothetical protein